jgi:hypothetical protein
MDEAVHVQWPDTEEPYDPNPPYVEKIKLVLRRPRRSRVGRTNKDGGSGGETGHDLGPPPDPRTPSGQLPNGAPSLWKNADSGASEDTDTDGSALANYTWPNEQQVSLIPDSEQALLQLEALTGRGDMEV